MRENRGSIKREQVLIADEVLFLHRDSYYMDKFPSHVARIGICGRGATISRQEAKDGGICFHDCYHHNDSERIKEADEC